MPVFISHSFKDEAIYSAICLAFDGAGVYRWDSNTMALGVSLADQLRKAIIDCEVCVFLATRSSIESPWCLAEVGAFWGFRKKVIIFLADPDLTDSILPPQFKGNMMARNAHELIKSTKEIDTRIVKDFNDIEFIANSSEFGETEWLKFIYNTNDNLDIMGVSLLSWRQTTNFRNAVMDKAERGCKIRILMMYNDNPVLHLLASDFSMLQVTISQNYSFFKEMSRENGNVEVRQLHEGLMYFNLTLTDQYAAIIPFLASQLWGRGPLWKCNRDSLLYNIAKTEFDTLWRTGK